jgi:flagellar motility protein MotE (MotC chaperone)
MRGGDRLTSAAPLASGIERAAGSASGRVQRGAEPARLLRHLGGAALALKIASLGALVLTLAVGTWPLRGGVATAESVPAAGDADAAAPPGAANPPVPPESRGVRDLVAAIGRREAQLAERETALARREADVAAAAKDLEDKIGRLEALARTIAPESGGGPEGEARMQVLAKIYETMKAEEAAPILDRLDDQTVRALFARMKEKQISQILPLMNREKAVALTRLLARGGAAQARSGERAREDANPAAGLAASAAPPAPAPPPPTAGTQTPG